MSSCNARPDHTFGSVADIARLLSNVRFTPESGQAADVSICLLCANRVHLLAMQPPLKSPPLISPRQYWHSHLEIGVASVDLLVENADDLGGRVLGCPNTDESARFMAG